MKTLITWTARRPTLAGKLTEEFRYERVLLQADLAETIHKEEYKGLIVNLGPSKGRVVNDVVEFLGRSLLPFERGRLVV
jgi:hypothetical protein